MAITILASPSGEPSVQDNLWHIAVSDASGTTDMKYVFDVYVGGVQKIRVKQFPEPTTGKAYFDAGPVVRNTFTYEWFEPLNTVYCTEPNVSGEIAQTYQVRYGEEVSGITTTNLASGNTTAYNWAAKTFQRRVADSTSLLNKWYTNRPLSADLKTGENLFIPFKTNTALTLKVDTYDANNNLISANVDASGYTAANGYIQCNIGTAAINARFGSTVIGSNVKYYDVYFNSLDKFRVNLVCDNRFSTIMLHFVNQWGMYDTARFPLVSRLTTEIERKEFTQKDYKLAATSVTYYDSNNVYHDSKVNYLNKRDGTYKLTSDFLTDAEWVWIEELMYSPQVYMELDGYYYPVTIKNSNIEISKYVNNRLRALEIEVSVNQTRYSHLR